MNASGIDRRRFVTGVGATLGLLGLSAKAQAPRSSAPVKIALIVPLSGPWSRQGQVMDVAAKMAVEHINREGGIKSLGGAALELVIFDAGDSVERAKNAAQRMVAEHPDLVGATGAYLSSFTLAVSEVTERAELPLITLSYSDLITSRGFRYIFQSSATGVRQAEESLPILLDLAASAGAKRPTRVGIVMDSTAASVAFVKPIKEGGILQRLNLDLVVDETFTPPLANATPLIQRVRAARPDLFFLLPTAISDAKLLIEKMNEFGLGRGRLPTVSNGAAMGDPDLGANVRPEMLEGVMSVVANWGVKGHEQLAAEFKQRTGEPWLTQHVLCAYGQVQTLAAGLEVAAQRDRRALGAALHALDVTDGPARFFPGGRIRFDEQGRRIDASLLVIQWQKGVPVTVYPPAAAVAAPLWPT
ncbi:MAG TPA: ABC transporter substrate-binding protein [Gammaproteobacteria bacterium]|nr:ABC transporter substrate-binding protein [Gammaproteobacteria bacterium]